MATSRRGFKAPCCPALDCEALHFPQVQRCVCAGNGAVLIFKDAGQHKPAAGLVGKHGFDAGGLLNKN